MPRDLVELKTQVKAASDILDVISGYLPVQQVGKAYKCVCPFHNDTRPSLQIDRKWQNFHCWACGAKGDVFTFVEKYDKVGFLEAMQILARRAGIPTDDATASPQDTHKFRLFDVMKWAQAKYQQCLLESPDSQAARKYLGERHLAGASVRQFGLGFAPLDGEWLVKQAQADQVPPELLVEVGLIAARDEARGYYDRFRDRVMFPIRDAQGRAVGFGGRIMPDSPYAARGPKYYNSPETLLFKKQEQLYGIDMARHAGSSAGFLAVVEGYTDVMMAHQSGIANVVATMGTALNARHVAQLVRHVRKIVLVFDADDGGNTGVDRALEIFVSQDVELAVATLPEGLDPADLLAQDGGAEVFRKALGDAVDALDFKLNQLFAKAEHGTVDGVRRMLDIILGIIALAPPVPSQSAQLKQELILTRLAQRLGVELRSVRGRLKELQLEQRRKQQRENSRPQEVPLNSGREPVISNAPPAKVAGPAPILESQLVQILLAEPDLVRVAHTQIPPEWLSHSGLKRMLVELYGLHEQGIPPELDNLRVRLIDRPDLAAHAMKLQDVGRSISDRQLYFNKVVDGFAKQKTDVEKKSLKEQLGGVGTDDAAALDLLRRFQGRTKEAG
ncbi:DNA primase [Limnoglobus roseus]|uniref:DNA primase n=1 Tax=Limnoglobus roseus TaxID=2598579 RepID=A0A5C1AIY4_9BACT|nr:DNA primase [Limnoglobus roseus]QEL17074.1 DNA primase [Limnoglobus roseus]